MMKKLSLIFALALSSLFFACNDRVEEVKEPVCTPDTVRIVDTVYLAPKVKAAKVHRIFKKKKAIKPLFVDTLAIIEKYKAGLKPVEVVREVPVHDTVVVKTVIYAEKKTLTIKEVQVEAPKTRQFFGGFGTTINNNVFNSIYLGGLYKTKRDEILKLDVGIENNGEGQFYPFIGTGIYIKIK